MITPMIQGTAKRGEAHIEAVLRELTTIRTDMIAEPALSKLRLDSIHHSDYQASVRNLLHYLALRRHDLRPLQRQLADGVIVSRSS